MWRDRQHPMDLCALASTLMLAMEPVQAQLSQLFDDDALIWRVTADPCLSVDGDNIHPIQASLGHRGLKIKMSSTRVRNRGGKGVYSPLDRL